MIDNLNENAFGMASPIMMVPHSARAIQALGLAQKSMKEMRQVQGDWLREFRPDENSLEGGDFEFFCVI